MRSSLSVLFVTILMVTLLTSCRKTEGPKIQTIDFESLPVPQTGYWNGSDALGSFTTSSMKFNNEYNVAWKSWSGFSYSQKNDVSNSGFDNEFSVIDPVNQKNKFAVFYPSFGGDIFAQFGSNMEFEIWSIDLCNSTYAGLTLKNGNAFCKKFGGIAGTDPDWFKVTIVGYNRSNVKTGSVEVYLADYRFSDPSKDYVLDSWTAFDLKSLGKVNKITFSFSSTDTGAYGINTPTYVCLDNIKYVDDQVIL